MARHEREIHIDRGNGRSHGAIPPGEPSLGQLFGQLSTDAGRLVQQEIALAKAELRETGQTLTRDALRMGAAVGLGVLGALAATAFLILALGDLFDNYWASALLVAVVLLGTAAVMAKSALNDIRDRGLRPDETLRTLREDADWAKREAREMKRDLTSQPTH